MRRLTILALAVVAMASCAKEESTYFDDSNVVKFTSGAISRVSSDGKDFWEKGDSINIITTGLTNNYSNVTYVSNIQSGSAQTTGFVYKSGTEIVFPNAASGSMTFYACYPYTEYVTLSGVSPGDGFDVSIADQKDDYGSVDFMTAEPVNKAYGSSVDNKDVDFVFSHELAKVVITVGKNDNLLSLAGLTASVNNIYKSRGYTIAGVLNKSANSTKADDAIALTVSEVNGVYTVTAILHPMDKDDCSNAEFTFSVTEGGKSFDVPFNVELTAGYIHNYTVDLGNDYPEFKSGSTIVEWNGKNSAATELTPVED